MYKPQPLDRKTPMAHLYVDETAKTLSHDALRMRLKRLCEKKAKSQKCHVDAATHEQYARGGADREWLEIALLETLQKVGLDAKKKGHHKTLVVACLQHYTPFKSQHCRLCSGFTHMKINLFPNWYITLNR